MLFLIIWYSFHLVHNPEYRHSNFGFWTQLMSNHLPGLLRLLIIMLITLIRPSWLFLQRKNEHSKCSATVAIRIMICVQEKSSIVLFISRDADALMMTDTVHDVNDRFFHMQQIRQTRRDGMYGYCQKWLLRNIDIYLYFPMACSKWKK